MFNIYRINFNTDINGESVDFTFDYPVKETDNQKEKVHALVKECERCNLFVNGIDLLETI